MSWIAPALRLTARLGFRWAPGLGSCLEPPLAPGPGLRPARGLEPRLAPRLGSCLRPRLGSRLRSCLGRRGNVAVVVALLSVPLAGFAGLAVDSARIFLVQSRLQQAVDAAVLTAARQSGQATAQADATALFWTNFGRNDRANNAGFLGASSVAPVITANDATGVVRMEATALVPTTLFAVLRPGPVAVTAAAEATRTVYGMELAIAFDLTGSMHLYSRIEPAKAAARDMINILYGNSDTRPNLSVAIAPFVTSYNIGKTRTAWLQAGSYNAADFGAQGWRGCVEARPNGGDQTDDPPSVAPFRPFLYRSTHGLYAARSYFDDVLNATAMSSGDNDWAPGQGKAITNPDTTSANGYYYGVGPNVSCHNAAIMPLTASKAAVLAKINSLYARMSWGTHIVLGLQAGWLTLSPKWRGLWDATARPVDYGTPAIRKVLVLMTDGENEWLSNQFLGATNLSGALSNKTNTMGVYTGYGRLSDNRLGGGYTGTLATDTAAAIQKLNERTAAICTNIKNQGVTLYAIGIALSSSVAKAMLRQCATSPAHYFDSPTTADIGSAFRQIGSELASLHLSR